MTPSRGSEDKKRFQVNSIDQNDDVINQHLLENVISGIQLYNKKYHEKLNHFYETAKDG